MTEFWGTVYDAFYVVLGLEGDQLNWWQMSIRALVIYIGALALIQIDGGRRLLGKNAAFDVILGIIFGSVLSRAVNGDAAFFETVVAGAVLIALHWLFGAAAFYSHTLGTLVKGRERILIKEGQLQEEEMRAGHLSERDLLAAARVQLQLPDLSSVQTARLERSGDISFLNSKSPQVVEVTVKEGVQTVRIELV